MTANLQKKDLAQAFGVRLREALLRAGYESARSSLGVHVQHFANLIGYSPQICRKYLRGQAIPEPAHLLDMAKKLNVSPGWLLFGDSAPKEDTLVINKAVLHHLLTEATILYRMAQKEEELPHFLLALIEDISKIETNEMQLKKIIDLALASATHFR